MGAKKNISPKIKKALVTGGGGFVGQVIVKMLTERGVVCRVIGRNSYPEIEAIGAECVIGDICDPDIVTAATKNIDTVFHVAALAGIWGSWEKYYETNVLGTRNVIDGCRINNISRLIYTSTPSVVFNQQDIIGGDETLPYATHFLCNYAKSKVMAEKHILAANCESLLTCAIRPHLIWGPGDPHLIPRLIESGRKKKLKIVGTGDNVVDISYVDNVAHGHILAAHNLATIQTAAGNAYFIGQEKPVTLWNWINSLFSRLKIPEVNSSITYPAAYKIGGLLEFIYLLCRVKKEPKMTRFLAQQLSKSHYFSHKNAHEDFGYSPIVSTEEGLERVIEWVEKYEQKKV
jgi:nucleoside-diphosphate-sugar epimerase